MSPPAEPEQSPEEILEEKEFYLDEFDARTICFAISLADFDRSSGGFDGLGSVVRDLLANDTRVILLFGLPEQRRRGTAGAWLRTVRGRLRPYLLSKQTARLFPRAADGRRRIAESFLDLTGARAADVEAGPYLADMWEVLRTRPLFVGLLDGREMLGFAGRVAVRLRVHKLVIAEPAGGICTTAGSHFSFMDRSVLEAVLHDGEAEWAGVSRRRRTLKVIKDTLDGGVRSVNLCTLDDLPGELFTYEGKGTLFTEEDYCRVERLGIDDFEEVERLIKRGHREGYLKGREPREVTSILLSGYGAHIGDGRLAGICALETEPYGRDRAGELVGLYTITRFKGEGVGARLVERVLGDAAELGLRYVFACTTEERAAAFFERQGFRRVTPREVPRAKWAGYDRKRLRRLKVLRIEVTR